MQAIDVLSHARPRLLSRAEVAESSLAYDRETKAPLYAECDVDEYWVVNTNARRIEVCDQPQNGRFQRVRYFEREQELAPSVFPDIVVRVADVFP